jgi:CHAT domain-containing protein/tetratricopeptide (TPR) repeat protein
MRIGRGVALAAMSGFIVAAVAVTKRPQASEPHAAARRLSRAAMDSQLALNYSAAYALTRQALLGDPAYVPAVALLQQRYMGSEASTSGIAFLDSVAASLADRELAECYRALARFSRGYEPPPARPPAATPAARDCQDYSDVATNPHPSAGRKRRAAERLVRRYPDEPRLAYSLFAVLAAERQWEQLGAWGREWSSSSHQPMMRVMGFAARAYGARTADSALLFLERDWTRPEFRAPGVRAAYLDVYSAAALLNRDPDHPPSVAFAARIAGMTEANIRDLHAMSASGDSLMRVFERTKLALWFLDRGRLDEAMATWRPLLALADSMGDSGRRAYLRMRYGRTLVKLGRNADAERELLLARRLVAECDRPDIGKEVEHNLFHLYDARRRDVEALAAGTEYVRLAALRGHHAVRVGSTYDLGMFFRARGDFEQSRRYFERMLADIDSLGNEWNYGGEYFELTGELDRARAYYQQSLRNDSYESRAQAGLVRVALATGDDSAAVTYARLHDVSKSTRGIPESAPLLPRVLRSLGRIAEARAELDTARATALRRGQVAAWASLTLETAQLSLSLNAAGPAAALADSAADAAGRVASTDVQLRARATAALARARDTAQSAGAIRALRGLARATDRMSDPQLRAEMRRDLGSVLAARGRWREALGELAIAAGATDSIASRIALDPAQAGYRSVQRSVYDAAMTTIVRHASGDERVRLFEDWSARRKGRAYGEVVRGAVTAPVPAGNAILDFVVLADSVAVAVRTTKASRVLILPIGADSLRRLIQRFVSRTDARVGSLIDQAHASFPLAAAHALYRVLLEPLAGAIGDARALAVIPDGATWLVPFDALVVSLPAPSSTRPFLDARFVIDDYTVTVATSPAGGSATAMPRESRVAALAPGVDSTDDVGAIQEVRAVARAMPAGRVDVYRGDRATEAAVRAVSGSAGVIHFATHAIANSQDPSMSWLALSAANGDDGRLHAFEIDRLSLHGALVVLDACETASGRALEGEGVLSLSRSFLKAGASATIATLWPVGPGAAPLMEVFYSALGGGADPDDALRIAKLARRRTAANPFEWAAYMYVALRPPGPSRRQAVTFDQVGR